LRIADYKCQLCNTGNIQLNVHHRSYDSRGNPDYEIDDLIVLCKDCHEIYHKKDKIKETV
jgi:5-methylcytosine-specific restriction endonuclease McrA